MMLSSFSIDGILINKTNLFLGVCSQDLLPDMKKSWPDLLNPLSASFWYYIYQSFNFILSDTFFSLGCSSFLYYNLLCYYHIIIILHVSYNCSCIVSVVYLDMQVIDSDNKAITV